MIHDSQGGGGGGLCGFACMKVYHMCMMTLYDIACACIMLCELALFTVYLPLTLNPLMMAAFFCNSSLAFLASSESSFFSSSNSLCVCSYRMNFVSDELLRYNSLKLMPTGA